MPSNAQAEELKPQGETGEDIPSRERAIESPEALAELGLETKKQIGNRALEAITRGRSKLKGIENPDVANQVAAVEGEMQSLAEATTKRVEEISGVRAAEAPIEPDAAVSEEVPVAPETGQETEPDYDPAVERLNRDLEVAATLEKLESGAELSEKERMQMAGTLENRGWHKIFNQVKPGEAVVSFLVPSGDVFSIKNFNDNLFGMQKTDDIIIKRRQILSQKMKEAGLSELSQSYKDGTFKLSAEQAAKKQESMNQLKAILETVNQETTAFIQSVVESELRTADDVRRVKLEAFRQVLADDGYRMSYGVAEVGRQNNESDFTHVETALSDSLKGAMVSRGTGEGGAEFSEARKEQALGEIRDLRNKLEARREITDASGRAFRLFDHLADGTRQLNLDVIRDVRKGKFQPKGPEDHTTHGEIFDYLGKINLLDVLKPYTHDEIAGEAIYGTERTVADQVRETNELVAKLREGAAMTEDERKRVTQLIRQEGKDRTCTSSVEFNREALKMKDCTYLSLDVLDVGPKLLQEFEHLLQKVEAGKMSFTEASLVAGDRTTKQMREFRAKVSETFGKLAGGERPLMLVGGDEATLAIDNAKHEVTNEFLLELRRATNSRVVKTVVGGAERHSDTSNTEATKKEHLEAQKLAERGTEIAKSIEKGVRDIRLLMNDLPKDEQLTFMKQLEAMNVRDFAVKQAEGNKDAFYVIGAKAGGVERRSPEEVTKAMNALKSTVGNALSAAYNRVLAEFKDYKGVNRRNAGWLIRMRNASTKEQFNTILEQVK